jgi:hypothetical protein
MLRKKLVNLFCKFLIRFLTTYGWPAWLGGVIALLIYHLLQMYPDFFIV